MPTTEPKGRDVIPGLAGVLRAARLHRGLTLDALAAAAGVSRSAVAAIEAEQRSPSARVLVALCGPLGLSLRTDRFADDLETARKKLSKIVPTSVDRSPD